MRIFPENLATYEPNNFSISLFWTGPSDFSVEQNFVLIFLEYSKTETCDAYLYNFVYYIWNIENGFSHISALSVRLYGFE